jgi:cytoskeletal protein CcmA (bactofilin family)
MFNKTSKPAKTPPAAPPLNEAPAPVAAKPAGSSAPVITPAAPAAAPRNASVLSADLTFDGNVSGSGDLQVDGTVKGDVRVGKLIVGETGNIEGSVQADVVEVRGRVVGAIAGKQVRLTGSAYVDGDISHEQLSIDVGAFFQGRCLQQRPGMAAPAAAQPAPVGFATTPVSAPSYGVSAPADGAQLIELKPSA